jgi:hypothetical protein
MNAFLFILLVSPNSILCFFCFFIFSGDFSIDLFFLNMLSGLSPFLDTDFSGVVFLTLVFHKPITFYNFIFNCSSDGYFESFIVVFS